MSKRLIIAEKPSVAKDIAKALGGCRDEKEYLESEENVITWAVGHLVEFIAPEEIDPKYKAWKLEDLPIIPKSFNLKAKDRCTPRLRIIAKLAKRPDIDAVVNACDAGREGELIFRELIAFCKIKKPILRLWLQSMTPEAIRSGFDSLKPGAEYENLYQAAQCRAEADWLIGINSTRALTRRLKTRTEKVSWSAGRVQTPTLAMLQSHELDILQFRPAPYWRLKAEFALKDDSLPNTETKPHTYEAVYFDPSFNIKQIGEDKNFKGRDEAIFDKKEAERIEKAVKNRCGNVTETRRLKQEAAQPLFDLTSLQREANRRFGMSAKSTLAAAQRLYESHKLITYPRTSSKCLPSDYVGQVRKIWSVISAYRSRQQEGALDFPLYASAAQKLEGKPQMRNYAKIFDNSRISDHFAIIPTTQPAGRSLRDDEAKIYNLILRRFLAAFFPPSVTAVIERITTVEAEGELFSFRTRASFLCEKGWREVYGIESKEESAALPELGTSPDHPIQAQNIKTKLKDEITKPPARITEARLLSLMEKVGKQVEDEDFSSAIEETGLGTPATRAEIIEALLTRGYIERADHGLKATTKGIILIDLLKRIGCRRLASPELTGQMEYNLNQVEHGTYKRKDYMGDIIDYTKDIVVKTKDFEYADIYADEKPLGQCPICHRQVYEKMRFYACEANQGKEGEGCSFIVWKDKNGRYIDTRTMKELLEHGETEYLEGFKGSGRQTYRAKLRLKGSDLELETDSGTVVSDGIDLPVSDEVLGVCPFDKNCRVNENASSYQCQQICVQNGSHKKGFSMPRIVCQRPISHDDLAHFLNKGRTELLDNFVSRFNKPFKGYIVLNKNTGRYAFEFAPRFSKAAVTADNTAPTVKPADDSSETAAAAKPKRATRKKEADSSSETAVAAKPKRATRKKEAD
ncbi:MAG: DNA topoisomerase 3, partial [Candidatus Bruticola sp.]